jgi:UDP-N-acetylglucosamine 1-carboxyvinyltransferase
LVEADDIRAGAALILAALARKGTTQILDRPGHIKRGYEDYINKFRFCGSQMQEVMVFVE